MADKKKPHVEVAESDEAVQRFINELKAAPAGGHVVHGMIKPAESNDGLMFSHAGDCENWIFIAATAIQSIQRTGQVGCGAHSHNTADIQLKAPQSDLEKALACVASLHQAKLLQTAAYFQSAGPCPRQCQPGTSCKQDQYGNWGCFP
jgi:hypothetical protein